MDIQDAKIGTRLELELINSFGTKIGQTYVSQLIDIKNKEDIIILCPIFESQFVFIASGSNVRILFLHEKFGLLSFTANITSREKSGNILLLHTKITSEIEKIQRRKYYRQDCILKSEYRVYTEPKQGEDDIDPTPYKKAIAKNLSGNGTCIVIEENIQKGTLLEVKIYTNENTYIRAIGPIMRNSQILTSRDKKFEMGLYFKEISSKDQDILVKYVFDLQRLQLRKNT
jgi:c-di-GMP-binding flagellar brake protein YcgR